MAKGASLIPQLVKNLPANAGDPGLIPGLGRSPEEGKGYLLQYSCLENSTDCIVHGVAKSRTQLSDLFTFTSQAFQIDAIMQCVAFCDWLL